jgi:hypothetical protein
MRPATRAALLAAAAVFCLPAVARAGMPSVTLSDAAGLRLQTISFFLAGLLLSAWLIKLLWNYLRQDFAFLPRLTYGKAVGLVALWGLLFVLVLTMISGARELMTPGAWEKNGLTYRLPSDAAPPYRPDGPDGERRQQLERLRAALWQYAQCHDGAFPPAGGSDVPAERWLVPGSSRRRYLYVEGQAADRGATPLAYEPEVAGPLRLVLLTSGKIRAMEVDDILRALPAGQP